MIRATGTPQEWSDELARCWKDKDVPAALELFAHCEEYWESPFDGNAMTNPGGLAALWDEVHAQSDIRVRVQVIAGDTDAFVTRYDACYVTADGEHRSSGVWAVRMAGGHCTEFRQWFMGAPDAPRATPE